MISFKCSAACGDIIYTLPVIQHLSQRGMIGNMPVIYYIDSSTHSKRQNVHTYSALKELLESQFYIHACLPYNGQMVNYDFDSFRRLDYKKEPMPLSMGKAIGVPYIDYSAPWMFEQWGGWSNFIGINITNRYKPKGVDYYKIIKNILDNSDKSVLFIGTPEEYKPYSNISNRITNPYTRSLLEVYNVLNWCDELYCNQSSVLTIAQAMNHPDINLFHVKGFNNVLLGKEKVYDTY